MNETTQMTKEITKITVCLTTILVCTAIAVFPAQIQSIAFGIVIGSFSGLLGFVMIIQMTNSVLEAAQDNSFKAYASQIQRYLIYALIFGASIYCGVNPFALLIGILAHKASILIYTWRHRKEDD